MCFRITTLAITYSKRAKSATACIHTAIFDIEIQKFNRYIGVWFCGNFIITETINITQCRIAWRHHNTIWTLISVRAICNCVIV